MSKRKLVAWALAALLAAGTTSGQEKERSAATVGLLEQAAPGWMERGVARVGRAIERLGAKLSGRGSMMEGCGDTMGGGGMMGGGRMMGGGGMMGDGDMMGGGRPNERWREPENRR